MKTRLFFILLAPAALAEGWDVLEAGGPRGGRPKRVSLNGAEL